MRSKISRKGLLKIVVLMLVLIMLATSACTSFVGNSVSNSPAESTTDITSASGTVDNSQALANLNQDLLMEVDTFSADERVNYIIEVDDNSLFTKYESRKDKTMSYQDYVATRTAKVNAENMTKKHKALFNQISKSVEASFVLSYTGIINAFAVNIRYGDRNKLKAAANANGALSVSISERYEAPTVEEGESGTYEPVSNIVPAWETGIFMGASGTDGDGNDLGYLGENMVVAVLDTGLDYEHDAFTHIHNLPTLVDEHGNDIIDSLTGRPKLDESKIKFDQTYISERIGGLVANNMYNPNIHEDFEGGYIYSHDLSASDVYVNAKVPFAYDYADFDPEVNTTQKNSHGTHVSGIIVGRSDTPYKTNKYGQNIDKDGNVTTDVEKMLPRYDLNGKQLTGIEGVAPLAQLVFMKVFSDFASGAEDIYLFAALQDCAALGVDVVNLSLGRGSGFSDMDDNYVQQISFERLYDLGIEIVVAASNGYSSAMGGQFGTNLITNPDSATLGSPSSIYESFAVASINGSQSMYILGKDSVGTNLGEAFIQESSKGGLAKYDFVEDLTAAIFGDNRAGLDYSDYTAYTKNGTAVKYYEEDSDGNVEMNVPFVVVPGYGRDADYGSVSVSGKIALVSRGVTTFVDKLQVAKRMGAIAVICFNNVGGVITMSLDENEVRIPSCSITMDEAAPFKAARQGVFTINENLKAGPFMSEFSSWGPTPSLELKPEITGHGGEIYSSYPGNNYNTISGTSMACPNIAGLTILARQHITKHADIYGLNDESETFANDVQALLYQMMMSTATLPMNKEGNPYSPRKIGAGLADINSMLRTRAYIVTEQKDENGNPVEMDRTKLELGDDIDKKGEYNMEFIVRNIGDVDYTYNMESKVFTESVASDKKTVAEMAYMLDDVDGERVWTVDGLPVSQPVVTVRAGEDARVTLKIQLSDAEIQHIDKTFENGMYVEGFVRLTAVTDDEGAVDLGVPFLGFFGDWHMAPILDQNIYDVDKDEKDDTKNEEEKLYAQGRALQAYGMFTIDGTDYVLPLGPFLFGVPEDAYGNPLYTIPYATYDSTTLSLSQNSLSQLYFVTGFLRGAQYVEWEVRDKVTGELMVNDFVINARKDARASNVGGINVDLDLASTEVKNGATYVFSFTAWLERDTHEKDGVVTYSPGTGERNRSESWSFEFSIDTDAPIITDSQLRVEKNMMGTGYTRYLDLYVHDDFLAQAMTLNYFNVETDSYESFFEEGLYPINGSKNTTTRVTFNLTSFWDYFEENETYKISTQIYDYSFNASHYEIDLSTMMYTGAEDLLAFGEIGSYSQYKNASGNTLSVLNSTYDSVRYNADGSYNKMTEINVVKNQTINLSNAVVTDTNVWPSDLTWRVDKESLAEINKNGELIIKANNSSQDMVVNVTATATSGLKATLRVIILSDDTLAEYNISNARQSTLEGVSFSTYSAGVIAFKAGESKDVEIEINPWFVDTTDLVVEWKITDTAIASITPNKLNATVTAKQGKFDEHGNYTDNFYGYTYVTATVYLKSAPTKKYSTSLYIYVYKEFVTNGPQLIQYNGTNPNVVIPESLGITSIADRVFMSNHTIETLTLPEGLETIGFASFAYCKNLKKVTFPSTLRAIGEYAFTGYYSARDGLNTALQQVDTTRIMQPLHIEKKAFVNNIAIGTSTSIKNSVYVASPVETGFALIDSLIDTSMFRVVGDGAFSGCGFMTGYNFTLDLTNLRTMGEKAFSSVGFYLGREDWPSTKNATLSIILGEKTDFGLYGLTLAGGTSLVIKSSRIVEGTFSAMPRLTSVTFEADNVFIEKDAFLDCELLTSVTFKSNVKYIGESAFANTGITNLKWSDKGVERIGDYAFSGAPLMEELVLPLNIKHIGLNAFSGEIDENGNLVSNIKKLVIPAGLTEPFSNFSALENTYFEEIKVEEGNVVYSVDDNILMMNYGGETVMVLVPTNKTTFNEGDNDDTIFTVPDAVTKIGYYAFSFNPNIERIDLNNVSEVSEGAMQNMKNLKEVWISDNMTEIPAYMFAGCSSLTDVYNTEHIEKIGAYAFAGTVEQVYLVTNSAGKLVSTITDVVDTAFEDVDVTEETEGAFRVVRREIVPITSIDLTSCTEIGEGAFMATGLTRVELTNEALTYIDARTFYYCLDLKTVILNDNITDIFEYAFFMTGIESLTEGTAGIEYVGDYAFAFTDFEELDSASANFVLISLKGSLAAVKLPAVEVVGEYAFASYYGGGVLTNVELASANGESSLMYIGANAFEYQSGVKSLSSAPLTALVVVDDYAFAGTGLSKINMPNLEYIGRGAFYDCVYLSGTVEIPNTVTYIAPLAFAYTEITAFAMDESDAYTVIDGVLFRMFELDGNEVLELAHYPTGVNKRDITSGQSTTGSTANGTYSIPSGTVRVAESAFTTVRTLGKVIFPDTIEAIGDKAFFGSNIKTYEFTGFDAPVLESKADGYIQDETHLFYWALYANFYSYFSPTSTMYSWTTTGIRHADGKKVPVLKIYSASYQYRYNTITSKSSSDTWIYGEYVDATDKTGAIYINYIPYQPSTATTAAREASFGANNSIDGSGDMTSRFKYDLTIIRPSNGIGYDSFLYTYYFDNVLLSRALMTEATEAVNALIAALPNALEITAANYTEFRASIEYARRRYDQLTGGTKDIVTDYQKLVACEQKIANILASIPTYTVYFIVNNVVYQTKQVAQNDKVILPAAPTPPDDYAFEGWYYNGAIFDDATPVTANMTIVANFVTDEPCVVSFRGIGVDIESQFIEVGGKATQPENPAREGYTFDGWYTDNGKYDFSTEVTGDITLYAQWSEKGCGCGTIIPNMNDTAALLIIFITLAAFAAVCAAVLLKKRQKGASAEA